MPATTLGTDLLDRLAGIAPGSSLAALRAKREAATGHTQGSYDALFVDEPATGISRVERFAVALRVATLHEEPAFIEHFASVLRATGANDAFAASASGGVETSNLPSRLQAMLKHADLLVLDPAAATPDDLRALEAAGLTAAGIVTLSQPIAFTSYQIRVFVGLSLLNGAERLPPACNLGPVSTRSAGFTQEHLSWMPWIEPFRAEEASEAQRAVLPGARLESPYFRLLALDPAVLRERTATDLGIFTTEEGLPRAERELSAAVTSRLNGCIYCASVHSRAASQFSDRREDVQRVLDDGIDVELDPRWRAVTDYAAALAVTPPAATQWHLEQLREHDVDDLAILDATQASAFFGWANRLMLTLGEPVLPG